MLSPLRQFIADNRLTRQALRDLSDHDIQDLVRAHIRRGEVVVLRPGRSSASNEAQELRRLIAQIDRQTHGRLTCRGRQYKLVLGDNLAKIPGRDAYEVVPQAEARAVLDQISRDAAGPRDLLVQAQEKLSKDWQPPFSQPDGLVLLRRTPVRAATPKDLGPAITPSQMRRLLAGWLEVVVVWDDTGQPIAGLPLTVESSGNSQSLTTDSSGRGRVDNVDGPCLVTGSFADETLDQCVVVAGVGSTPTPQKKAAGSSAAAPRCIVAIEAHKVKTGETLASIAADAGTDWQTLAKFNWGTDSPNDVNEHLRDDVGCTKTSVDGREYLLDDSDTPGIIYLPSPWSQTLQPGQTHYIRVRRPKGILIMLENEQGLRLPEVGYRVQFEDGTERTGLLGRNGMALVPSPSAGIFQVTYPDESDIMAKSLAACVRKGFDDRKTDQIFRLFTHDRPVVARAVAAYDRYFNDYTGQGLIEDLYQELTEPEALAVCEALMALHGLPTQSGVRVAAPSEEE